MQKNEVLAVVGGREITQKDVETLLTSLNPQTARQFQSEEGMKNLVSELANQELFYLDAKENKLGSEEGYLLDVEKAKLGILKQYALNKLLNTVIVTESDIENYYVSNKQQFVEPPSVEASHILVDSEEKAQEIADEIKQGLSFEDAAMKYSSCPSKEQGGNLGYFTRGKMVPEFEQAAFEMEIGETSAPVQTQFGYHLIKVVDKKDGSTKSLDDVKNQIGNYLLSQKQNELYQKKVDELRSKYSVKINV